MEGGVLGLSWGGSEGKRGRKGWGKGDGKGYEGKNREHGERGGWEVGRGRGKWGGERTGGSRPAPQRCRRRHSAPRAAFRAPPRAAAGRGRASGVEGGRWRRSCCAWCPLIAGTWSRNEGQDGGCRDGTGSSPGSW